MVSAWASANRLVLGQTRVDDKSNEITAIPKLLSMLELSGCVVTIDAMGCQKEIAQKIIERGADYTLSLKQNQRRLHEEVSELFDEAGREDFADLDCDWFETVEKGHGRVETRRCRAVSDASFIAYLNDGGEWPELRSVAMVESERYVMGRHQHRPATTYRVWRVTMSDCSRRFEDTGGWRTRCIGHWTYPLGRTTAG